MNLQATVKKAKQGAALMGLLVVIAIIALLIAILLPSLSRAREQALRASGGSNERQVACAMMANPTLWKYIVPLVGAKPPAKQCDDGIDNDGDGLTDFPEDPGCDNKNDNDEYNEPQGDTCNDTDGGNVLDVFGTTSGEAGGVPYSHDDVCVGDDNIEEYSCSGTTAQSSTVACGTHAYGSDYCNGTDVYRDYTEYACASGECSSTTTPEFVRSCPDSCTDGVCTGPDPTWVPTTATHSYDGDVTAAVAADGGDISTLDGRNGDTIVVTNWSGSIPPDSVDIQVTATLDLSSASSDFEAAFSFTSIGDSGSGLCTTANGQSGVFTCDLTAHGNGIDTIAEANSLTLTITGQETPVRKGPDSGDVDQISLEVSYAANPVLVSAVLATPEDVADGTSVTISADVSIASSYPSDVAQVEAQIYDPSNTRVDTLPMLNSGGDTYATVGYTASFYPAGTYTARIWASDDHGNVNNKESTTFDPYVVLSNWASPTIDGYASDWSRLATVTDPVGDSRAGMAEELLVAVHGSTNAEVKIYRFEAGGYTNAFTLTLAEDSAGELGVGDLDNDGVPEIVTSSYNMSSGTNTTIQFWSYNAGAWYNYYTYTGGLSGRPSSMSVADLDNDGRDEVAFACWGQYIFEPFTGKVLILEDVSGSIQDTVLMNDFSRGYGMSAADLDNDGYTEILVPRDYDDILMVYEYDGASYVNTANVAFTPALTTMDHIDTGDLNGDGIPDLVACGNSNTIHILASIGDNSYEWKWDGPPLVTWAYTCGAGDMNGDGRTDVAASLSGGPGSTHVFEKSTDDPDDWTFGDTWSDPGSAGGVSVGGGHMGDYDGDGRSEWAFGPGTSLSVANQDVVPYGPPFDVIEIDSYGGTTYANHMTAGDIDGSSVQAGDYDLATVSLANNESQLFVLVQVEGAATPAAGEYYRLFISTSESTGSGTTLGSGAELPILYDYMVESVDATTWVVYDTNGEVVVPNGNATAATIGGTIEVAVPLEALGVIEDSIDIVFETSSDAVRYDLAPDFASFIRYEIAP